MHIRQALLNRIGDHDEKLAPLTALEPQLLLVFGAPAFFESGSVAALAARFAGAVAVGCSTAGEIAGDDVLEQSCVLTAVRFERGADVAIRAATAELPDMADSRSAGRRLGAQLAAPALRAVLVFSPGVRVNGSALIAGLVDAVGEQALISGGLAGDYGAFARTWTLGPAGVSDSAVVAVGLYGDGLEFGHGSFGGWETFGPARQATRCDGNVLYELDGAPALDVYKRYLGDYARDLPASGLLFPLAILGEDRGAAGLIRTILGVDERTGSLILAGDVEADGYLKLMHASTDALIDGAEAAALAARSLRHGTATSLCLLVSCVGRRLVMGDRVDEEVEAVARVLGNAAVLAGFYSHGEIGPFAPGAASRLHNQTMTITSLTER